jgi:UDP-N-acetyl-alpha-D-muramoyl-L-alanyl-L-glutamate epimerase
MAAGAKQPPAVFDPAAFASFRFLGRELDEGGVLTLRYALDDGLEFSERLVLPMPPRLEERRRASVEGLLSLLHWVAGVSYFKTAAPPHVACERGAPPPATAALLDALYSEGLGEFAFTNELVGVPRPRFAPAASVPDAGEGE